MLPKLDCKVFHLWINCDQIWENPPYGICMRFVQCEFLVVAQIEICQSSDFIIYMSSKPNCCCLLQRLVVL